jgi:hypothetical protein
MKSDLRAVKMGRDVFKQQSGESRDVGVAWIL